MAVPGEKTYLEYWPSYVIGTFIGGSFFTPLFVKYIAFTSKRRIDFQAEQEKEKP